MLVSTGEYMILQNVTSKSKSICTDTTHLSETECKKLVDIFKVDRPPVFIEDVVLQYIERSSPYNNAGCYLDPNGNLN